jgi:DGQHR domain-containing protein
MKLDGHASKPLRCRALKASQLPSSPLYLFMLSGKDLLSIAEISRISRDDAGKLIGYQRPEVKRHVQEIIDYLNGKQVLFPNSVILALSSNVRFIGSRGKDVSDGIATAGTLEIPIPSNGQAKPAWIVDGQQRLLAISKCRRKELAVPVSAFVSDDVGLQRDQFVRVNNTKPLPRGLITELLPEISTPLPANLAVKQIPSTVCDWLCREPHSPFAGLVQRPSATGKERGKRAIAIMSLVKMVEDSLMSPSGCLFPYRNIATGETDLAGICAVLATFWTAVKQVFPDAWGKPPDKSRLMHGTGIRAMGRVMDRIMASMTPGRPGAVKAVVRELKLITPVCRWTGGTWEDLNTRWDEIQNVHGHIRVLSNLLIRSYLRAKGNKK